MTYPTDYEKALAHVLENGSPSTDRTGTGTIRAFGVQMRFDLAREFPCITSKRLHWKSIVGELRWMLKGSTNNKDLQAEGVTIWDEWADPETGDLGPIYGKQWRNWESTSVTPLGMGQWIQKQSFDQIKWVVDEIKVNPDSRRLLVSAWNVADLSKMALMPCHTMFQFFVQDGKLHCHLYQRSGDMFLGVPFNIASYALLTHMVAACTGLEVGELIHTVGDAHIYANHVDQVKEQLSRDDKPRPQLFLADTTHEYPWQFGAEEIQLVDYKPHPAIKAPVAV